MAPKYRAWLKNENRMSEVKRITYSDENLLYIRSKI